MTTIQFEMMPLLAYEPRPVMWYQKDSTAVDSEGTQACELLLSSYIDGTQTSAFSDPESEDRTESLSSASSETHNFTTATRTETETSAELVDVERFRSLLSLPIFSSER